jgi:hypothetical protein
MHRKGEATDPEQRFCESDANCHRIVIVTVIKAPERVGERHPERTSTAAGGCRGMNSHRTAAVVTGTSLGGGMRPKKR